MQFLLAYFALLLVFLLLAVFFSASETAFMAVDRLRLKYLAEAGDKQAEAVKGIISNPDRLLGVILFGSTVANIAAATLVTYLVTTYVPKDRAESASVISSIILTVVVLILCELTPKIIAAAHAERVSRKLLWPARFALWFLSPVAQLATWIGNLLVRLLGLTPGASPFAHALSEEEIRAMISSSAGTNMAEGKKEMLSNVFQIAATQVRQVMIPRTEVTAVDIDDPIPEILNIVSKTNYSRIPVHRGGFDNVIGILNVKDLLQLLQKPAEINLQVLLRPVQFVPDTARLESVLRQMQSMHLHLAVVVDEFGGVEGIVTLEDILEEIVGEIRDEHDTETDSVRKLAPNLYAVSGNLPVKDFNRVFKIKLPESREYTTVAGFLQARTGRLLQEGETVRYKDYSFSIEKVEGFKVVNLRVRLT